MATPLRTSAGGTWVEGEWVPNPEDVGTPFACALFLPQTTTEDVQQVNIGRRVTEPTLLYEPYDVLGGIVGLDPEDSVLVTAEEINVAQGKPADFSQRWQVVGDPQPFGRPGSPVVGLQATLRKVDES
jgi:hypothetical protein